MKLITKDIEKQLVANYLETQSHALLGDPDGRHHKPVLKLFGGSSATWLITEKDGDMLFGLCDLGMGTPELGYVSLSELESIKFPPFGLPIERDSWFEPRQTIAEYAKEARELGYIKS